MIATRAVRQVRPDMTASEALSAVGLVRRIGTLEEYAIQKKSGAIAFSEWWRKHTARQGGTHVHPRDEIRKQSRQD